MRNRMGVFGLLLVATVAEAGSQPTTLSSLVQEALRSNPDLQAAKRRWEASRARVPQAGSLDDPQIRLMWMNLPGNPVMSVTPNDLQYRFSLTLPFPGKRALRSEIARKDVDITGEENRNLERDILRRVKSAYYDLYLAEKKIEVNARNTERVRGILETVRERYGTGRAVLSDVLTLQNELAIRLNNDQTFREEKRAALARLNLLLNRHPSIPVEVGEVEERGLPEWNYAHDELERLALTRRPELRQTDLMVQQGKTALELARAQYKPDFMFMVDRQPGQVRTGGFDVMLSINLPFLFRKKYDYGLAEAKANISAAESTGEAVRNAIAAEIETLLVSLQAARRLAILHQTVLIPQAEDAYEVAATGYQTGAVDFVRLTNALISVEETRLGYYQALTTYLKQIAEMERAVTSDL